MHYTHRLSSARIHQIVGWFVLVPVLILGAVLFVVSKNEHLFEEKYPLVTVFSEGYGLKVGHPVMMLGIEIGRIGDIEFTDQNDTRFTLKILKKYKDKIRTNSVAKVGKSGGFIGDPQIEITAGNKSMPVVPDGGHLEAEEPFSIAELMAEAKPMLESIKKTLGRADDIMVGADGMLKTGQAALAQVQEASTRLPLVMDDVRGTTATIKQLALAISKDVPTVTSSARKTIDRVGDVVEDVKKTTAKLPSIAENAKSASDELKGVVHRDVPSLVRSAQGTMDDVNEIVTGAKKTFPISTFATKGRAAAEENRANQGAGPRSLRGEQLSQ